MQWLKDKASSAWDGAKSVGTGMLGKVGAVKDKAIATAKSISGKVADGAHAVAGVIKDSAGVLGTIAKENAGAIGTIAGSALGSLAGPAGTAMGAKLGNMAGNWVQGGGLEKTKVGQAVTGLAKSIHSGDGDWKQHLGNVAMAGASKLTSRVAKHYVGGDMVHRVKVLARERSGGGAYAPRRLKHHSTTGPSNGGGPTSNVYDGGGVRAKPSAPSMTSAEDEARSRRRSF
jgi:hypothetical protein